jgi:hypothetical protein
MGTRREGHGNGEISQQAVDSQNIVGQHSPTDEIDHSIIVASPDGFSMSTTTSICDAPAKSPTVESTFRGDDQQLNKTVHLKSTPDDSFNLGGTIAMAKLGDNPILLPAETSEPVPTNMPQQQKRRTQPKPRQVRNRKDLVSPDDDTHQDYLHQHYSFMDCLSSHESSNGAASVVKSVPVWQSLQAEPLRPNPPERKRRTHKRFNKQSIVPLGGESKVEDLYVDDSSFQCAVELPHTAKPGDRCIVQWPKTRWSGDTPQTFVFECPQSLEAAVADDEKPRRLLLVAPNAFFDPLEKMRLALLPSSAPLHHSATRGNSSVQIGKRFQVDQIPPVCHEKQRRGTVIVSSGGAG